MKNPVRKTALRQKAQLMSASEIERTLVRLAYEIVEKNGGVDALGLVGIRRRGVPIAERLGKIITRIENAKVPVGSLDITFYRDDLSTLGPKPVVQEKEVGFEIGDKNIVLVDDVLFTGRTTRAALDALFEHGRPRRVQLCVLIDRGHREIPVEATFVGRNVQTTLNEVIEVKLTEIDEAEKVHGRTAWAKCMKSSGQMPMTTEIAAVRQRGISSASGASWKWSPASPAADGLKKAW